MPIHRYLNRLRLREALEPITEGEVGLSELALGLGFSSHSHFTASFRKEFGISPRDMKKLSTARVPEMVASLFLAVPGPYSQGISGIRSRSTSRPSSSTVRWRNSSTSSTVTWRYRVERPDGDGDPLATMLEAAGARDHHPVADI